MDIACAIIAGGENKRMKGKNKAFIEVDNTPIIHRTIDILKGLFDEILLVTNTPDCFKIYASDTRIITDIIKDIGPLGGIHSALSQTTKEAVFFVACDMPFLHNDIIRQVTHCFSKARYDAVVPRIGAVAEPLHSVFRKDLENRIYMFIKKNTNYSIRTFLETINTYYLELEDIPFYRNIFRNLNTPEDVEKVKSVRWK